MSNVRICIHAIKFVSLAGKKIQRMLYITIIRIKKKRGNTWDLGVLIPIIHNFYLH